MTYSQESTSRSFTPLVQTLWKEQIAPKENSGSTAALNSAIAQVRSGDDLGQYNEGVRVFPKRDFTTMENVTRQPDLRAYFDLQDEPTVNSFLKENQFLESILFGAYFSISERFDSDLLPALEVFSDPEEGYDQLFVLIRTRLPAHEAQRRLDVLYDDWWLDVIPTVQHKMAIDIELA